MSDFFNNIISNKNINNFISTRHRIYNMTILNKNTCIRILFLCPLLRLGFRFIFQFTFWNFIFIHPDSTSCAKYRIGTINKSTSRTCFLFRFGNWFIIIFCNKSASAITTEHRICQCIICSTYRTCLSCITTIYRLNRSYYRSRI